MKRIIKVLFSLCLVGLFAFLIYQEPGYVLLKLKNFSIQTPWWIAAIALLIVIFVSLFFLKLVSWILSIPMRFRKKLHKDRQHKQQKALQEGLLRFLVEDWESSKNAFEQLSELGFLVKTSHLMAAKSAFHQGAQSISLDHLDRALELPNDKSQWLVDLFRIDLCLAHDHLEEARQLLARVAIVHPKNLLVLQRQLKLHLEAQEWQAALAALSALSKFKYFSTTEQFEQAREIHLHILRHSADQSTKQLQAVWDDMSEPYTKEPRLLHFYASQLIRHRETTLAEVCLRKSLKSAWSEPLFLLYCQCVGADSIKQMEYAEGWFKESPQSAATLLAMGNLYANQQYTGKAKQYYQTSLKLKPTFDACVALAALYLKDQQYTEAATLFQQAVSLKAIS